MNMTMLLVLSLVACILFVYLHKSIYQRIIAFRKHLINLLKSRSLKTHLTQGKDELDDIHHMFKYLMDDLKRDHDDISKIAFMDSLTGVPNRIYFYEELQKAMDIAKKLKQNMAVLFVDLDRFKHVNDSLGHHAGDELLKSVSARLLSFNHFVDLTLCRMSGDEFTIIIQNSNRELELIPFMDKMIVSLAEPYTIMGQQVIVTASMGLSIFPRDGETSDILLKNADMALYKAKELGKNNYCFYTEDLREKVERKGLMERQLRKAISNESLYLMYQPKIDVHTGAMVGTEALLRWDDSILGVVSPGEFIPLAEETNLIVSIGEWVLRSACEQNIRWTRRGMTPMVIGVNLSTIQFEQHGFIEMVSNVLLETGMKPELLEIEITESFGVINVESAISRLNELKKMGISIAVDDFGTGYSSLNYLKRLPIDCLKIDKSFVDDITQNQDDAAIATAIVALAKALQLDVTAEGVETFEQMEFLKGIGCTNMQGFLFSRPLTGNKLEEFFMMTNSLVEQR
ncbi:putative bifunctional diguanylate cyclase/phosphodiesterase [Paenibacillus sp. Leaf72]|uniref:putative bifunctional diguanylate cyclase/phosphodiesterase n=1 Tax=Paenibacillus sp. Leaf72 TaxID=1736234 RepID=UPI000A871ADE|nr:bifunctional diguanylate cyclase/phosphodiesterase [Paenibacillus sp. Leaf72]